MGIDRALRFLRTVQDVPLHALMWRVWARLKRVYYASPLFGVIELAEGRDMPEINWVGAELIAGDVVQAKAISNGKFTFAGVEIDLGVPPRTWLPERASPLWIFNLHYHEWLADLRVAGARDVARALIADWLLRFSSYHPTVWHPYPTSLRLVVWLTHGKWLLEGASDDFRDGFLSVLVRQAEYLADNCEWDLKGNHLLKNLKAMIYAGLAIEGQKQMFERGMAEFMRQLKVQIHPDGGHYEASPLYMAQVLRDVLEVRVVLRKVAGDHTHALDDVAACMGTALATLAHRDGGLSLFNDSAELSRDYVAQLLRLSGADDPLEALEQTGYARLERGQMLVLFDAGKVGPDENPGHAHADTLSFELDWGMERVIVNCGTYAYQHRLRGLLRSTAAHSTVEVNGDSSCEVWAEHRVGRRPRLVNLLMKGVPGGELVAEGDHDGYRHLGVTHRRKLVMAGDGSRLRGEDALSVVAPWWGSVQRMRVLAHFHLHPQVSVRLLSEKEAELTLKSGKKVKFTVEEGRLDVKDSQYSPQLGVLMPCRQVLIHGNLGARGCVLGWQLMFA